MGILTQQRYDDLKNFTENRFPELYSSIQENGKFTQVPIIDIGESVSIKNIFKNKDNLDGLNKTLDSTKVELVKIGKNQFSGLYKKLENLSNKVTTYNTSGKSEYLEQAKLANKAEKLVKKIGIAAGKLYKSETEARKRESLKVWAARLIYRVPISLSKIPYRMGNQIGGPVLGSAFASGAIVGAIGYIARQSLNLVSPLQEMVEQPLICSPSLPLLVGSIVGGAVKVGRSIWNSIPGPHEEKVGNGIAIMLTFPISGPLKLASFINGVAGAPTGHTALIGLIAGNVLSNGDLTKTLIGLGAGVAGGVISRAVYNHLPSLTAIPEIARAVGRITQAVGRGVYAQLPSSDTIGKAMYESALFTGNGLKSGYDKLPSSLRPSRSTLLCTAMGIATIGWKILRGSI